MTPELLSVTSLTKFFHVDAVIWAEFSNSTILGKIFGDFFFHVLPQLLFTTTETEVDYYHQKVSVQVASRVAERLKT